MALPDQEIQNIIDLFNQGYFMREIAILMQRNRNTISKYLKLNEDKLNYNIHDKRKSEVHTGFKHTEASKQKNKDAHLGKVYIKYIYKQIDGKSVKHRHCIKCKQLKPITEFYYRKDKNRYEGQCLICYKKYKKKYGKLYPTMQRRNKIVREKYNNDPEYRTYKLSYKNAYKQYGSKNIAYCKECKQWKGKEDFNIQRGIEKGITELCTKCLNKIKEVHVRGRKQLPQSDYFIQDKRRL